MKEKQEKQPERIQLETLYGIRRENGRWRVVSTAVDPKRLKFHSTGHAEEHALKLMRLELARQRSRLSRGIA